MDKSCADPYKLTVTVGKPTIEADPSAEYYLRYTPDGWSDDTLSLHVDSNGLMQSARGQSVDQTAGVGTALVQIAAIAAGFPGSIGLPPGAEVDFVKGLPPTKPSAKPAPPAKKCELPSLNRTFEYEPGYMGVQDDGSDKPTLTIPGRDGHSSTTTWRIVSNAKPPSHDASQWADFTLTATLVPRTMTIKKGPVEIQGVAFNDDDKPQGILFRDWANWTITIDVNASDDAQSLCHVVPIHHEIRNLLMPNSGNLFWENMNRQPLINKQISLTVQNGMLTGVDPTRPSTVLAWIKLPLTIIQPIISAPFQALAGGSKASSSASTTSSGN